MQLNQFFGDDDAVSPVIGVILMVAITVILAAVIATFVLGLGEQVSETAPTASFSSEYDSGLGGTDEGVLTFTHDGGDTVEQSELYVRGSGIGGTSVAGSEYDQNSPGEWAGSTSGTVGSESAVVAGDSADIAVVSDYDVRVVYEAQAGDTSATLASDQGPDA